MAKKIPPTGWRPGRGGKTLKRLKYTTLWSYLQAIEGHLLLLLIFIDRVVKEVMR